MFQWKNDMQIPNRVGNSPNTDTMIDALIRRYWPKILVKMGWKNCYNNKNDKFSNKSSVIWNTPLYSVLPSQGLKRLLRVSNTPRVSKLTILGRSILPDKKMSFLRGCQLARNFVSHLPVWLLWLQQRLTSEIERFRKLKRWMAATAVLTALPASV